MTLSNLLKTGQLKEHTTTVDDVTVLLLKPAFQKQRLYLPWSKPRQESNGLISYLKQLTNSGTL